MVQERPVRVERRLSAILAADVAGYSRLMHSDEEATHTKLSTLLADAVAPAITEHGGRMVKSSGDGFLADFPSAVEAVRAAMQFQSRIKELTIGDSEDTRIAFRVGINIGDVIVEPQDIFGDGVNIAARLESIAEPGGICISSSAYDHVRGKVDIDFVDLGEQNLKNIPHLIRAYAAVQKIHNPILIPGSTPPLLETPTIAAPDMSSIAVRPFQNLSGKRELEFFIDGLVEDVIALLARVPGFFVISKASSFAFRDPDMPTSTVARQLGVRYVLGGSARTQGDQIRVATELADAETGRVLWSQRFDALRTDVIKLQDEITRSIIIELQPALTQAEIAVIRRQRPENVGAWGCYHQAQGILAGKGWIRSYEEVHEFLRRALRLDPHFALARAQLAVCLALPQSVGLVEPSESLEEEIRAAAERAIADDNGSSEVLGYAGCAITDLGDISRGEEILRQAVEIDPSNAQAHVALGATLVRFRDLEGGIARMRHGIKLSPRDRRLAFWGWALGSALMRAERPLEALEEAKLAGRRDPRNFLLPLLESLAHLALGHHDLAKNSLTTARRLRPELTLSQIGVSHGAQAATDLAELWNETSLKTGSVKTPDDLH
jgi:adenylate cyclase